MSKYTILSAGFKVLASANTLHMAKRAFYDEIGHGENLILLDGNLDSYAIFRDGKVVAGRKWQAFVKSSYHVPKVKVPTAPAPIEPVTVPVPKTREQHEMDFNAWVAENNLIIGDNVKVTRKCQSFENGWTDSWNASMDKFVGQECEVIYITSSGSVKLKYDNDWWFFPHFVLEVVPTIRNVCLDTIKQIQLGELIAETMATINFNDFEERNGLCNLDPSLSAKEVFAGKTCKVCAVGGMALSWIKKYNEFSVFQTKTMKTSTTSSLPQKLVKIFGKKLLNEIEVAFELNRHMWWCESIEMDRQNELIEKYRVYRSSNRRLIAIMQDVADGKF